MPYHDPAFVEALRARLKKKKTRKSYTRECRGCGISFVTGEGSARFHSPECSRAYWRMKENKEREEEREEEARILRAALPKGYYELRRERLINIRRSRRDYIAKHGEGNASS